MAKKIIDNKAIEMTEEEFVIYRGICRSYDRPNFNGEELFRELFESDDAGYITFIRPPSTRYTSMECYLFICSIYMHQNIRLMNSKVDRLIEETNKKVDNAIANLKK